MSGDYLWDGTGPRDPEVVRLEKLLGQIKPADLPSLLDAPLPRRLSPIGLTIAIATAAAIVACVAGVWMTQSDRLAPPLPVVVSRQQGAPTVGGRALTDLADLPPGVWVDTTEQARVRVDVGDIGRVELGPGTRLKLVSAVPGRYRVFLERGTLRASIFAPPGRFLVDTASATAVDLGCAFEISVDENGVGRAHTTSGWVGVAWRGREAFIPAGAVCATRNGAGPGTPHFEDRSSEFLGAIETIDAGAASPAEIETALDRILRDASAGDTITLWHLLSRVDTAGRDRVFDRLAAFVPPPRGVTRAGVHAGNRPMLDQWWNALRADTPTWWSAWTDLWPNRAQAH